MDYRQVVLMMTAYTLLYTAYAFHFVHETLIGAAAGFGIAFFVYAVLPGLLPSLFARGVWVTAATDDDKRE